MGKKDENIPVKHQLFISFISLCLVSCAITGQKHHYTGTKHNNKGVIRTVKPVVIHQLNSGIIYGNYQTYTRLKDIKIKYVFKSGKIDSKSRITVRTFANGNFIAENLRPGRYIITSVETKNNSLDLLLMAKEVEFFSIKVLAGQAVYAGTFKIAVAQGSDKMILMRSAKPTEKKILKHITLIERDTLWLKPLKMRIQNLI